MPGGRAISKTQQAIDRSRTIRQYEPVKANATVIPCCHEEHAWWVMVGPTFLSTFDTKEAAEVECERLRFS